MSIETLQNLSAILDVVQDARVRALRWDAVPNALVVDVDCALRTEEKGGVRIARLCRGWLVIENARNLSIHLDWNDFTEGFSVVDIHERQSTGSGKQREYTLQTDFPEGTLCLTGSRLVLLRSTNAIDLRGLELPSGDRKLLASDDEFVSAFW